MEGLILSSLSDELHKVDDQDAKYPVDSIQVNERFDSLSRYVKRYFEDNFCFQTQYYKLPLSVLGIFSFDELCKMKYSSDIMMDESVLWLFDNEPQYEVVRKIINSMWRCGMNMGSWNEVVDSYQNLRTFIFVEDSDFELRLDYTVGHNECGTSKFNRTYIDGVFALLVYYKGEHVLTIGFSIMAGRIILLQQIQSAIQSGNRALYRLPQNRLEFVLSLFQRNFPGYALRVIDGDDLVRKTLADYTNGLKKANERRKRDKKLLEKIESDSIRMSLESTVEACRQLRMKIKHLKESRSRIASFYANTGRFTRLDSPRRIHNLRHYDVAP